MHLLEGGVPVGDGPDAADDRTDVELAAGHEGDDALPDGPVVAEAALERDVLLHQRVEVEAERLRPPPDFADPAGGADDIEGDLQGRRGAGGVDHAITAEAVALLSPGFGVPDDDFAAILFSDRETMGVLREADDGDFGTALLGHRRAENTDRAWPEDDYAVARLDAGVLHDGVIGDAKPWAQQRDGLGCDGVIDAAGASATLKIALDIVRPAGWVSKVGWGPQPLGFNLDPLVQKNITLQGSFSHNWPIWERVIALMASGQFDVRPIIGGVWPITDWHTAFEKMHKGEVVKSVLKPV